MITADQLAQFTAYALILAWCVFGAMFLFQNKPGKESETKRDRTSIFGIFLQGCAYALVWMGRPADYLNPKVSLALAAQIALSLFTLAVLAASIWLSLSAVRTLGRQWALAARLVEGHKLITEGPYRFVRNPIYTGMFGMLVAAGLALRHFIGLIPAVVFFAIGTVIRVRCEEKLLRTAFGQQFEDYASRVPAVLPGIF